LLTLREIRRYVARSRAIAMSAFIAVVYTLVSMLEGGMLLLQHVNVGGRTTVTLIFASGIGFQSWNYPGLLIVAPWGIVSLPFFGTISMALVAIGVGLGMSSAVMLGVALARGRSARAAAGPTSVGSLAGLTPAMVGLLALGACCSTTAAATAGVGVIAQLGGTTTTNLLVNSWYLGVFQIAVVWVALIAQEMLLRVYGGWFDPTVFREGAPLPRWDRRALLGGLVRSALLVGGVLWSLAVFVDWTTISPAAASAGQWADWVVLHFLVSALALAAALFPGELVRRLAPARRTWGVTATRILAGTAGVLLAVGVPPPLSGTGMEGLVNEVLGAAGLPASWGAVAAPVAPGLALAFRWGMQFLLLGLFALGVALRPAESFRPLLWSVTSSPWDRGQAEGVAGDAAPAI
jgi:hypothetical protein